jgi:hypothetical protein
MDLGPMNGDIPETQKKKKGNELDKKRRNLAQKKCNLNKKKNHLDKSFLSIILDQSIKY